MTESKIQIGKNGITTSLISEIKKLLMKRNDVKVRFLPAFIEGKDRKLVKEDLLLLLNKKGRLIGNTVTIYWR